ncbi:hypothetical protein, partial [Campylobacter concisus]|uniref:hypothetical protein n=1 Tax=Campylobacter concisus TaxID=199 RepID=UPI001F2A4375
LFVVTASISSKWKVNEMSGRKRQISIRDRIKKSYVKKIKIACACAKEKKQQLFLENKLRQSLKRS